MNLTSTLAPVLVGFGVLALVAMVAGALVLKGKLGQSQPNEVKYKRRPLLSDNELEFLARLEAAMPELRFCPQVA